MKKRKRKKEKEARIGSKRLGLDNRLAIIRDAI